MKTLVLTGIRKIEMINRPQPEVRSPDDVLIRIKPSVFLAPDQSVFRY
ncbi:MAG: hypothetical protein Q8N05_11480 [Bacteroidota bacterium]|nr:hypothetical protein [Bacteroidota bacterium]